MRILLKYKQVILYLIFGVLTTLINIVSYGIFTELIGLDWKISNIISWVFAILFAYVTNRLFVFDSVNSAISKEIISFFIFRFISLVIDMGFMYLFIELLNIDEIYSKLVVQVLVIVINYVFSKMYIFKGGV